jgi:hypothetical protein
MAKTMQEIPAHFSFSRLINERLQEAANLSGLSPVGIINEIVEENLPKWIQRYRMRHSFSKNAEKIKNAVVPDSVLINQDEVDKVFRLMSSASSVE